jgi:glutamate racemase
MVTDADAERPIGIFDSGIGGLTVGHAVMRRLPSERLIYFGDTARLPYGPKSPDTVQRYSLQIGGFLRAEGVKAIVIACNTATAHALPALRDALDVPVIGVVEPGARSAVAATRGQVGIIGTSGTIKSGAYERAIRALAPDVRVIARACPLFVPLVEEGWIDHPATRQVVETYLAPLQAERVDTVVLGCTHYPLLGPVIAQVMGPEVTLIDSAEATAQELECLLRDRGLLAHPGDEPDHRFIASDDPLQFLQLGQRFLGNAIEGVEIRAFD